MTTDQTPTVFGIWNLFQASLGVCMILLGASDVLDPHNTQSQVLDFFGLTWRAWSFWLVIGGVLLLALRNPSRLMALIMLAPLLFEMPVEVELYISGRAGVADDIIRTSVLFDVMKSLTIFLTCLRYIYSNPQLDYNPLEETKH